MFRASCEDAGDVVVLLHVARGDELGADRVGQLADPALHLLAGQVGEADLRPLVEQLPADRPGDAEVVGDPQDEPLLPREQSHRRNPFASAAPFVSGALTRSLDLRSVAAQDNRASPTAQPVFARRPLRPAGLTGPWCLAPFGFEREGQFREIVLQGRPRLSECLLGCRPHAQPGRASRSWSAHRRAPETAPRRKSFAPDPPPQVP